VGLAAVEEWLSSVLALIWPAVRSTTSKPATEALSVFKQQNSAVLDGFTLLVCASSAMSDVQASPVWWGRKGRRAPRLLGMAAG